MMEMLKPNEEMSKERQPQVEAKSKIFGKERKMHVFSIKFTWDKKGTKEPLEFSEGKELIQKITCILWRKETWQIWGRKQLNKADKQREKWETGVAKMYLYKWKLQKPRIFSINLNSIWD